MYNATYASFFPFKVLSTCITYGDYSKPANNYFESILQQYLDNTISDVANGSVISNFKCDLTKYMPNYTSGTLVLDAYINVDPPIVEEAIASIASEIERLMKEKQLV